MYTVTFKGFKNINQAKVFAEWYSGSGEQDSGLWLEEHSDCTAAYVEQPIVVNENNVDVEVKIYGK